MEQIKQLSLEHIDLLLDHMVRHSRELGVNGIIVQPRSINEDFNFENNKLHYQKALSVESGAQARKWIWGLFDDEKIAGHLDLSLHSLPSMAHRARLGLGIESSYRQQGWARKIMTVAIDWAKQTEFIEWLDLDVFAHNSVAIRLYEQLGFKIVGTTKDRFRVDGQSIDDHHMVLFLNKSN